jgi:hypothetical protein
MKYDEKNMYNFFRFFYTFPFSASERLGLGPVVAMRSCSGQESESAVRE